jgi:hypothetical protein
MLTVIILSDDYSGWCNRGPYAERTYTEFRDSIEYCYVEHRYAECRFAQHHYSECRYAECRYAECRYAECLVTSTRKVTAFLINFD